MLKWLRKYSRSWFIAAIIGGIVVVFIFWGVGGIESPRYQEVAVVDGQPILLTAYLRAYNEVLKQYQERSQGELNEEMLKQLRLKEQAIGRLIDEALMFKAAQRLGIRVSDAELQEEIMQYPYFQEDGKFNEKRYRLLLSRARLTPTDFEEQERRRLLHKKVIQAVTSFAKVSDGELQELFRMAREAVAVQYLVVGPERFLAAQKPGDEALAAYYKDHQEEFRTPERAKVRYLLFQPTTFAAKVAPSAKEVEEFLRDHAEAFTRPKVIRVKQIFLPLPAKATPADRNRLEKQAQDLLKQARLGGNFTQLVKAYSKDDRSRFPDGDPGDISRGTNSPSWDKVAFSLNPGEVGWAADGKGYYVIKLEEIKETEPLPEAEAKPLATQRLKEEKGRRLAREAVQDARGELSRHPMAGVAKKYGLTVRETPLLAKTDPVPDLGMERPFNEAAMTLKPQEISKLVELPQGFAVLQGMEHQPAALPPLEQVKEKVRAAVSRQQAKDQAVKEAGRVLERLRQGEPLTTVAAQAGLPLQDSGFFSRMQGFMGQPLAESLTSAAFQLSAQKPYPPQPLFWKDKYYILAFKGRRSPTPEDFHKEREKVEKELLEAKREMLFSAWLSEEKKHAKIKIFDLPS